MDVVVNCWDDGERVVAEVFSRCGSGGGQESTGKEAGPILSVILSENIIKCVEMSETAKNFKCVLIQVRIMEKT